MTTQQQLEESNAALRSAVETRLAGRTTMEIGGMVASLHGCKPAMEAAASVLADPPTRTGDGDPYSEWIPPASRREEAVAGFRRIVEDARPAREARAARASRPRLIGIAGRAGSGKNTVADMIPGSCVFGFADPLYEMLAAMLRVSVDSLRDRSTKERPIEWLGRSPRHLLQTLGTEWGRQHVAQDVWMRLADQRVDEMAAYGVRVAVVADVRFPDEAAWVRDRGGEVWHLRRPGTDAPPTHVTESGIDVVGDEPVIVNDGTVEELREKVEQVLSSERRPASRPERITDLELAAMESRARLVGSANCWTGTGGSVAADAFRLIAEVRRLRAERDLSFVLAGMSSAATTPEGNDDA